MQKTIQRYAGFPNRVRRLPVPAPLLGSLLEQIDDLLELKCTLRVVALLLEKRENPRFVTLRELQADRILTLAAAGGERPAPELIEAALGLAVKRGTLAFAVVSSGNARQPVFGLNTYSDKAALAKIATEPPYLNRIDELESPPHADKPNIFALYEQNIGILSPIIADELREAEQMYPEEWIEEAIKEAVALNRQNWRYISRILQRWEREGRTDGKSGRYPKTVKGYS